MSRADTDSSPFTASEQAFWQALVRAVTVVPRLLDNELDATRRLKLNEYAALVQLDGADKREMRIGELAEACSLTLSGMTRIVGRLVDEGFVERARHPEDGRGTIARLTPGGREALKAAAPVQRAWARRHVLNHLHNVDLDELTKAFTEFGTDLDS